MLFERFLRKTTKTTVAGVKSATASHNQETLVEQSRHPDPAQRRTAISQLQNLALLRQMLADDADSSVREAASTRYCQLLCDGNLDISLASRLDELARSDDPHLIERIAVEAMLPELRQAALERVQSADVLVQCAVRDALAANRHLAITQLHDKLALEQVAQQIGKKDKTIYRLAREKLRLLAEQEERPRRIRAQRQELCAKIKRLGRLGHWSQDRALLEHLDRQWVALDHDYQADADVAAHYQSERERFLVAYASICDAQASQLAQHEALDTAQAARQALLDELATASSLTTERDIESLCERIGLAWNALPRLPTSLQHPLNVRYESLLQAADAARQAVAEQRQKHERLLRIQAQVKRLLHETRVLDHQRARSLIDQGRALAATQPDTGIAADVIGLAKRLESRLDHQRKHAEQRLKQLPERLTELEIHLAAGELKKADPLYQSLHAGLELIQSSELPREATTDIASRLRILAPQLRELQHWRRWGADQHRETLCTDMDALMNADLPMEVLANQLHTLQIDWKRLDQSGSPANQALWERFHAASEAVYARCRPFMEAQAAERDANRLAREAVCQQIETFLGQVDWERVDWKKILRAERETRQTWAAIGETEGRHRKGLERRFHQSLRQLDRRLDAERKANQAHKHQLIEQVQALAESTDLDAAIEQTKALQRQWHTTVPARQKDENRLWQHFRAACDAVFERRTALHQAQTHELRDNLATRERICLDAQTLATSTTDPQRLAAGLRELDERWSAAQTLPVPRQSASQLARHWHDCRDALEHSLSIGQEQQRQMAFDQLQQQSDLCERFELSVLGATTDPLDPVTARQLWQQLHSASSTPLSQALSARFEQALDAIQSPERLAELRQRYTDNGQQRRRLCLQLEIIAGIESPPELVQQRLEFQVARLAERMVEGEDDPLQGATQLLHEWYLCGPAPVDVALTVRFERVRRALAT